MSSQDPIRNDLSPNAGSVRARTAITRLEKVLQEGQNRIIAGQWWTQVDLLEDLVEKMEQDLDDPAFTPDWELMNG